MNTISYNHFEQLDLKVGQIMKAEEVPGADKLYKLTVNLGDNEMSMVAGIKQSYQMNELVGKKVAVLVNLEPKVIRGVESRGMALAASSDLSGVVLLTLDKDIANGSIIK